MHYDFQKRMLVLDNKGLSPLSDTLEIQGETFFLEELDNSRLARGGNSFVFRAFHPEGFASYIVKFCRYFPDSRRQKEQKRIARFEREIEALQIVANSQEKDCVVEFIEASHFPIGVNRSLRYYVMEEGDANLRAFLLQTPVSLPQKVLLCHQLLKALDALHGLGIYHRDIKPENILIVGNRWKLGDLGLINYRDKDTDLDAHCEKVGPTGFLSPEATNKHLGNRDCQGFDFDCWMDEGSDLFQLGQLFWFILQDEVPTGQLHLSDFKCGHARLFGDIIFKMLQYPKRRRPNITELQRAFQPLLKEFAL